MSGYDEKNRETILKGGINTYNRLREKKRKESDCFTEKICSGKKIEERKKMVSEKVGSKRKLSMKMLRV